MAIHVVQGSETLWDIVQRYQISLSELVNVNGLASANDLVPGLALYIPRAPNPSRVYLIKPGDTLWKVAYDFNTSIEEIIRANQGINPNTLRAGQRITVPTQSKLRVASLGFIAPYSQQSFLPTLATLASQLTYLAVASFSFTNEGFAYVKLEEQDIVKASHHLGVRPLLMVRNLINSEFSPELIGNVLKDPTYRRNLVKSLVSLAQKRGYSGVSIDFEFIPPARRNDYIAFLSELKNALGTLLLHVNVHAKIEDIPENPIIGAYDYQRIGRIADLVAIMTIDYGYPGGPPDPVAPIWWVDQVITFSVQQIHPSKLQFSMPLYGYDKMVPSFKTRALSVTAAQNLAISTHQPIQYDVGAESPFFNYWVNNQEHIVWFEDIRSYSAKYRLMDLYNLQGVTYWQLSQASLQNWAFVRDTIAIKK